MQRGIYYVSKLGTTPQLFSTALLHPGSPSTTWISEDTQHMLSITTCYSIRMKPPFFLFLFFAAPLQTTQLPHLRVHPAATNEEAEQKGHRLYDGNVQTSSRRQMRHLWCHRGIQPEREQTEGAIKTYRGTL